MRTVLINYDACSLLMSKEHFFTHFEPKLLHLAIILSLAITDIK